ncbi:hypothetical protein [Corynebacterium aquatimens]|uniref:Uncharacterized protein n=1 Tax=Corynebacterium aquatimens TaxID=1190508 RepID=A0A931DZT6_9CORY|nr:hypothetical protein [Corynebacterium aquatimens]MBG6121131.1 hypothetical protein [Corynebacterium aquatimens]
MIRRSDALDYDRTADRPSTIEAPRAPHPDEERERREFYENEKPPHYGGG